MSYNCRAVLFDAGNTLLRVYPSVGQIYAETAARYGVASDPVVIETHFRDVFAERDGDLLAATSEETERQWWRGLVQTVFRRAGRLHEFGEAFDAYFAELHGLFAQSHVWRVFDDVAPALAALHGRGIRCAVVSNWDSRLPRILEGLDLAGHFEFVLTSAEVGRPKPHPLIFQRALERIGLPAQEVVYVGDSYEHDVVGAARAGLRTLLIARGTERTDGHPSLNALIDLPAWLHNNAAAKPISS